MPEKRIRVYLEEVVTHSFIITEPVPGDPDTTADAAEGVFVHSPQAELEGYETAIKSRHMLYSEPASG